MISCAWCRGPIPPGARRDSVTCSKKCRQARHRFRVAPAAAATDRARRFAYADPPYPGLARRYYKCPEVDHAELVGQLVREYPDGWALSTSADAVRDVLLLCPSDVRVAIWVRGSRRGSSYRARNAWEPLIVWGGRPKLLDATEELDDVLVWGGRQHSHPDALVGMKSAAFAEWMFRLLGAAPGDQLDDLFRGSGAVSRAWDLHTRRTSTSSSRCDASRPGRNDRSPLISRLAGAARRLSEAVAAGERDA